MITLEKPKTCVQKLALRRLYRQAFPAAERKPWSMIQKTSRKGKADIWSAMDGGRFAGLAITVNSPDTVLLDYLAVKQNRRNGGIGSAILTQLKSCYPGKGLFLEIESPYADCPDQALRQRR